jgi:hypothetical protein
MGEDVIEGEVPAELVEEAKKYRASSSSASSRTTTPP